MGLFHCPMGCAYYEDEPCIDCGLCLATTQEEMVLASQRIRDYLRVHAENRKGSQPEDRGLRQRGNRQDDRRGPDGGGIP